MMSREQIAILADYFTGYELVEYLQIPVEDVIEAFSEKIEEALDDIEELMGVSHDRGRVLGEAD